MALKLFYSSSIIILIYGRIDFVNQVEPVPEGTMFLSCRTINGKKYLYLLKSVYDEKKHCYVNKIVTNYGRYEKAPEAIRASFEDKEKRKLLERQLEGKQREKDLDDLNEAVEKLSERTDNNFNRSLLLHYGHLPLKKLWDKELGLKYKIDYLQRAKTAITNWKLNDLIFYLCSMKILAPNSYYEASQLKSDFLYCPWSVVVQDNFYRGLDFVYQHREELIEHAVKTHLANEKREIKVAFFDCTNTWFETPYDDLTWQIIRFTRDTVQQLKRAGLSTEQIEQHLDSEVFAKEIATHLQVNEEDILRMRGNSKEGRYSQPLVTVALAIDQKGFPIDCKVFAGNLSEIHTIEPVINSLKRKYQVKDVYFVADKGLNSATTLEKIQQEKLGFVVAQKTSRQNQTVQSQMFDLKGYKNYRIDEKGNFIVSEDEPVENASRFKVCDHVKKYKTENPNKDQPAAPKSICKTVSCKIIYTYSQQRYNKDIAQLDEQIAKATKAVNEGMLLGNPFGSGWRSLLATKKEQAGSKEEKELFRACGLKSDVIEQRRRCAGYGAVVFSHPQGQDISTLSDIEILQTYHRLVAIEDCFRTMKSCFSIRPVFVRLKERIIAHCYLCVLSLMLMKCLQEKLLEQGVSMTHQQVCEALSEALVLPIPSVDGKIHTLMNVGINSHFHHPMFTGKCKKILDENDTENSQRLWEKFKLFRSSIPSDIDIILESVGLKKLNLYNTVKDTKQKLGILSVPADALISKVQLDYIEALKNNAIR